MWEDLVRNYLPEEYLVRRFSDLHYCGYWKWAKSSIFQKFQFSHIHIHICPLNNVHYELEIRWILIMHYNKPNISNLNEVTRANTSHCGNNQDSQANQTCPKYQDTIKNQNFHIHIEFITGLGTFQSSQKTQLAVRATINRNSHIVYTTSLNRLSFTQTYVSFLSLKVLYVCCWNV